MPKVPYTKQALTFQQQLQQLKNRGLIIEDDSKALHLLESISYYRLSGYWYPLLEIPKSSHQFKNGSSFNQAFSLYCLIESSDDWLALNLKKLKSLSGRK